MPVFLQAMVTVRTKSCFNTCNYLFDS